MAKTYRVSINTTAQVTGVVEVTADSQDDADCKARGMTSEIEWNVESVDKDNLEVINVSRA